MTNPVLTRRNFCSLEGSSRKEGFFPPSDWQSMVRRDNGQLYCWSPFTSVPSGTGYTIQSVTYEGVEGWRGPTSLPEEARLWNQDCRVLPSR